jgi:hypothetical protein
MIGNIQKKGPDKVGEQLQLALKHLTNAQKDVDKRRGVVPSRQRPESPEPTVLFSGLPSLPPQYFGCLWSARGLLTWLARQAPFCRAMGMDQGPAPGNCREPFANPPLLCKSRPEEPSIELTAAR